jgi:hypothetical protein
MLSIVSTIFFARGTQRSLGRVKQSAFSCSYRADFSILGCLNPKRFVPNEHMYSMYSFQPTSHILHT